MKSARLDELTAMRGIAALMVVIFHARGEWHPIFTSGERVSMLIASGWLWVEFFFVLSGFVMMHAYGRSFEAGIGHRNYWKFVVIRFGRIYPLYIFVLAVSVLAFHQGWMIINDPAHSLIASVLLVQGFVFGPAVWNYPGWSISTEWFAYLVFPFLVVAWQRYGRSAPWLVAAILAATIMLKYVWGPGDEAFPISRLIYCVAEFALGCSIYRLLVDGRIPRIGDTRLATLCCAAPVILMALPKSLNFAWLNGVAAVGFAVMIAVLANQETLLHPLLRSRVLQFLGAISYSIYLNHAVMFRIVKKLTDDWSGEKRFLAKLEPWLGLSLFPLYLALLLFVSWLTWRYIEEPMRVWFKQRAGDWTSPSVPVTR